MHAVVLAGLTKAKDHWGLHWYLRAGVDSAVSYGAWVYLLPADDPGDVAAATKLLRAASQGQLSRSEWIAAEALIARTRSPTALIAALGTTGSRGGPPVHGCLADVARAQHNLHRPPLPHAEVLRRCASLWRVTDSAARKRILWLLRHPHWLGRRMPLQCTAAYLGNPPYQCRLGASSVWTPMALVRAALAPGHRSDNLPAIPGVPNWQLRSGLQGLAHVGRVLGLRSVPKGARALERWPKTARLRLLYCYGGLPGYVRPDKSLPKGCPLGHIRLGIIYLKGRGWVVDKPGDPWPGEKPWAKGRSAKP